VQAPSTAQRVLTVLIATLLLVLSASMAWAAVYDFESRAVVPQGVSVAGTDLSGMTLEQARDAIEEAVSAPVLREVTVVASGTEFTFDPKGAVTVDVDAMLADALQPRRQAPFVARVRHDVGTLPLPAEVEPQFSVDASEVARFVTGVANEVDTASVDASLAVVVNKVKLTKSQVGKQVDKKKAAAAIIAAFSTEEALAGGEREVEVPVKAIKPKVHESTFGKTIVVDLSERRIRLFKGDKIEKTYPCAIGRAPYYTPKGEWEITQKRFRPTWVNPAPNGWGADMPASIPPGPSNPLGTRAINLSAPGIRFHGTNNIGSVGTAASHGCMRMYRSDIEDLFERVEVGMKVYIVK